LARAAGIAVAAHRLVAVGGRNVSVITRFDRVGAQRIPFLSGRSLLGLARDDPGAYTRLADGIRQLGDNVAADLRELWRRLIFSLLASNYDDHLRNHGFLMLSSGRWALSPAYDFNPVPQIDRTRTPKTPIAETGGEPSLAAALAAATRFGLKSSEAKKIVGEVFGAVSGWRETGKKLRIKSSTLDAYATAFDHPMMTEARAISRSIPG
jgi:serine/threonine-protein kinase HipA